MRQKNDLGAMARRWLMRAHGAFEASVIVTYSAPIGRC